MRRYLHTHKWQRPLCRVMKNLISGWRQVPPEEEGVKAVSRSLAQRGRKSHVAKRPRFSTDEYISRLCNTPLYTHWMTPSQAQGVWTQGSLTLCCVPLNCYGEIRETWQPLKQQKMPSPLTLQFLAWLSTAEKMPGRGTGGPQSTALASLSAKCKTVAVLSGGLGEESVAYFME